MKFKKIWITSDSHWDHSNVIHYCKRPYATTEEMNQDLLTKWNQVVAKDDTVIHLGDFIWTKPGDYSWLEKLHGNKILVCGNHDKDRHKYTAKGIVVVESMDMLICKHLVRLSHYPYRMGGIKAYYYKIRDFLFTRHKLKHYEKRPIWDGRWLIHGHTHAPHKVDYKMKSIHVGVDAWGFRPVNLAEIEAIINRGEGGATPIDRTIRDYDKKWIEFMRFTQEYEKVESED